MRCGGRHEQEQRTVAGLETRVKHLDEHLAFARSGLGHIAHTGLAVSEEYNCAHLDRSVGKRLYDVGLGDDRELI